MLPVLYLTPIEKLGSVRGAPSGDWREQVHGSGIVARREAIHTNREWLSYRVTET